MENFLNNQKNEFLVSGYLADAPKQSYSKTKNLVAEIRLLQNTRRRVLTDTGSFEWVSDKPSTFFIMAFNNENRKLADRVVKYCSRGTYVLCKCSVRPQSWKDNNGVWHNVTRFILSDLIVADNKSGLVAENKELKDMIENYTAPENQQNEGVENFVNEIEESGTLDEPEFFTKEY